MFLIEIKRNSSIPSYSQDILSKLKAISKPTIRYKGSCDWKVGTAKIRIRYIVRKKVGPDIPILLSSGATLDNIQEILEVFDGVSVGTWIKDGNMRNPINPDKAKAFCKKAKGIE